MTRKRSVLSSVSYNSSEESSSSSGSSDEEEEEEDSIPITPTITESCPPAIILPGMNNLTRFRLKI